MKSNEYVKAYGNIPIGHCGSTEATGQLKAKAVIHAVQPVVDKSSEALYDLMHESIDMLEKTISNIILMANDKLKCRSLSIPAIPNSSKDTKFPMH
jgi:O-acetyl-ADP-ribose deacetylase (regulator of RNase III)